MREQELGYRTVHKKVGQTEGLDAGRDQAVKTAPEREAGLHVA